ncbi:MAG TPA: protoporphyrinogen oxidase [Terriglobales bacterium]|nr:protoporphyrinogen oxidase [Terriglobales bacterium]
MKRVAILGGGIAGLSAAHYLHQAGADFTLFEASTRFGGIIDSERTPEGFLVEAGPDSFLSAKPAAAELARELGLAGELVPSNDRQRKTYILLRNQLVPIPDGMQLMVPTRSWPILTSPLFSLSTKLRMLREFLFPPALLAADQDESVANFIARHFGTELVERLADPLLAGVYGGDSAQLSARAVLPTMVASEAQHRSLVRGALRSRRSADATSALFTTFRNGMRQLIDAIVAQLPADRLRLRTPVTTVTRANSDWRIANESFTDLIIALPAATAASLLWPLDPALSALLGKILSTSCVTVAIGFDRSLSLPPGFGFLVPRSENRRMLACTFVHRKFPNRAPAQTSLLRAFLTSGLNEDDASLRRIVSTELKEILGITAAPTMVRIQRWPSAMPQYAVGHLDRIAQIHQRAVNLPGLHLIGNAYSGVGVPDCIRGGRDAAQKIAASR